MRVTKSLGCEVGYPDGLADTSAGVAQFGQSSRLVSGRSWVRVPSPAQERESKYDLDRSRVSYVVPSYTRFRWGRTISEPLFAE